MSADRVQETLLSALHEALAEPGEHRLFRSGKLNGLFPSRSGAGGDAAALALRDGLIELVRTETRGKSLVEWVRLTPRGVELIHKEATPGHTLAELRGALQTARDGLPAWKAALDRDLAGLREHVLAEVERMGRRIDALAERVELTLCKIEDATGQIPEDAMRDVAWAGDAVGYLDRRKTTSNASECPLSELFDAIRPTHLDLTVTRFHEGLKRLQERRVLRLLPFTGEPATLTHPEFALPDGDAVLYFASR